MSTGTLIAEASLCGDLTGISELSGSLTSEIMSLEGSLSTTLRQESPEYAGPYNVIPSAADDITLPTADRHVSHDINVVKIPRYETSNLGGGYTFIIAED